MENGEIGPSDRDYDVNTHRAHLAAYVLIAGLLLELIASVIWFKGTETLVGMVAVLLIVGGVWGEVFFGNKARVAGDKELAEQRARAAEAIENTEKLRASMRPRGVRKQIFLDLLKDKPRAMVELMFVRDDLEAHGLATNIRFSLSEANWPVYGQQPLPPTDSDIPAMAEATGSFSGVAIVADGRGPTLEPNPAAVALLEALRAAVDGGVSMSHKNPGGRPISDVVKIVVGPKSPFRGL
jgi:hypothetical protein